MRRPLRRFIPVLGLLNILAFTAPALADCSGTSPLPAASACAADPAACQCLTQVTSACQPTGAFLEAFMTRGACPAFGKPLTEIRPRLSTGGRYQEYERGEIAAYSTWTRDAGASTPDFVLSAFLQNGRITAEWGSTKPFDYEFFILRWDLDDHPQNVEKQHEDDEQQLDVKKAGDRGKETFDARAEGTYVVYVEGCNDGGFLFFGGTDCDQGWSHPVYVDNLPTLAGPVPLPPQPPLITPQGIHDVPDSVMLSDAQYQPVVEELCKGALIDADGDHKGELATTAALAQLEAAKRNWSCAGKPPSQLRADVNDAIQKAVVVSQPGTDVSGLIRTISALGIGALIGGAIGALFGPVGAVIGALVGGAVGLLVKDPPGDYDMRLTGLIQIVHGFPGELNAGAREELIEELLTVRGEADERKDFVWLNGAPTPVLETENHLWMTESARYLTNNLLALEYQKKGLAVPQEYDNDANGMTDWILTGLRQFLVEDFYELNSRPYAHHVVQPIQNLADFAAYNAGTCLQVVPPGTPSPSRRCDVRRAARSVLDFLAAKFAASSNGLRRAAPFRRQPPFRQYPRLWTTGGDDMTWRYLAYTGGSDILAKERHQRLMEGARGEVLSTFQSYYRPPVLITDLIRSPATTSLSPLQRFRSIRRDADAVEIYYRHAAFLISAGGVHDRGSGVAFFFPDEDAWALPTTLMPTAQGADYRDFVRIAGHTEDGLRVNTCVAPGFACGMNPTLPAGLPASCTKVDGNWTFIDFDANTPDCPFGYGYYVAFYREPCASSDCMLAGTMPGPDRNASFGFFEATPYRSFDAYVTDVLASNQGWDYKFDKVNVYKRPLGGRVTFMLEHDKDEWGIVDYDLGNGPTSPERDLEKWPVANGDLMTTEREACLFIDNSNLQQRLILDHVDVNRPRRTIVELPGRECTCPLPDNCISPRGE